MSVGVTFVLQRRFSSGKKPCQIIVASTVRNISFKHIKSMLIPLYQQHDTSITWQLYDKRTEQQHVNIYGQDLFEEVQRVAKVAEIIATLEDFDVIHCHDWMTYPAGIVAKLSLKDTCGPCPRD